MNGAEQARTSGERLRLAVDFGEQRFDNPGTIRKVIKTKGRFYSLAEGVCIELDSEHQAEMRRREVVLKHS